MLYDAEVSILATVAEMHVMAWQGQLVELSGLFVFFPRTLRGVLPVLCYSGEMHILFNGGLRFDFSNYWCMAFF